MDIFELREHARNLGLADRSLERDPEWERGPVAIELRRQPGPSVPVRITVLPCRSCGDRDCRC